MATTPLGLPYPTSGDHTRLWEHLQNLADTVDALLTLPAEQAVFANGTNTITDTNSVPTGVLPSNPADASMTNPHLTRSMLVMVKFSAWLVANGAGTRVGIAASGGLTFTAAIGSGGALGYSEWLYLSNQASSASFEQSASFNVTLPANSTTVFSFRASRDAVGTSNLCNYPILRVTPLRYL